MFEEQIFKKQIFNDSDDFLFFIQDNTEEKLYKYINRTRFGNDLKF